LPPPCSRRNARRNRPASASSA